MNPNRRSLLQSLGAGAATLALHNVATRAASAATTAPAAGDARQKPIQGFEKQPTPQNASDGWHPISDRKIRVGLIGYGVCKFSAAFGFQDHPNVEVVAVSDLVPDRCADL